MHPATTLVPCLLLAASAAAQLSVTSASPGLNARGISPAAVVTLTFSAPLQAATVTAQNIRLAGRWSGPVPGQLTLSPSGTTVTFAPSRPLFASEIATLYVSRNVTSTTGSALTGGFTSTWWIDCAPSSGTLQLAQTVDYRLPGEGLIRTYGFFAGDVDRDGSPDMSSTNEVSWDVRLMKNDGCGNFGAPTVTPMPNGEEPSPNEGADFNGDGWIDLATGNQNGQSVAVFLNDGAGNYLPPQLVAVGGAVHGLAVLDADSDGDIDLVCTNQQNICLLRNNGNGTFAAPTFFDGGGNGEWSIQVADANGDGKPDLFCGTSGAQNLRVLLGNGNGVFTTSTTISAGGFPWQMATGDVNGDGFVDCVTANRSNSTATVFFGNGMGGLAAGVGYAVGFDPVSVDIGDLEGDDDLDIVVASYGSGNATMLRNNGAGTFGNASILPTTIAGSCAVIVDYDRDGDTDVIVVDELDDKAFVWRQAGPAVPSAQVPSCEATLRINSYATRAGYGGSAPRFLPGGQLAFFGISGQPGQVLALFGGTRLDPGAGSPFGLLNLDLGQPLELLLSGFGGDPFGVLDGNGERTVPVSVPPGLPPGLTLTMQCLLTTAAGALVTSNPEQVVF
jgi:hypothetical protein